MERSDPLHALSLTGQVLVFSSLVLLGPIPPFHAKVVVDVLTLLPHSGAGTLMP